MYSDSSDSSSFQCDQKRVKLTMPKRITPRLDDADTAEARWNQIAPMYLNPEYSDITIVCGGETFPAHRLLLCTQSEYFKCDRRFQKGLNLPEINLTGHAPTLIKAMLEFLYTGDYTTKTRNSSHESTGQTSTQELESQIEKESLQPDAEVDIISYTAVSSHPTYFHAQMYAKGAYFVIPGLKAKAKKKFQESFMWMMSSTAFTAIMEEVYSTEKSDRSLKDLAIELTMRNMYCLRTGKNPILHKKVMECLPEFTLDLCAEIVQKGQRIYI